MKIGIDARLWNETGVGRYIRNIVRELAVLDQGNKYVVFLMKEDYDSVVLPQNFKKVKTNIHWHSFAEQILLPIEYVRERLDLLFVPYFNVPIFYPGKFVTTIHDLTVLRVHTGRVTTLPYPIYLVKYVGAFISYLSAIKRSQKIFTVSQFVKNDIAKTFWVDPKKIIITPNAVDQSFYKRSEDEISPVLEKYHVNKPYLFYVGNAHPHKNLARLIQAFELVLIKNQDLTLVLSGKKNFFYERLQEESKHLKIYNRLLFTGYVDDAELPALYSGATAFVNPSLYEGFGIQILEAFACGCKVICSNSTSLPEIGDGLATYFDPYNVSNMAEVIERSLYVQSEGFTTKAATIVQAFSWKHSAQTIFEIVKSI